MKSKKEAAFRQMDRLGLNHHNVYITQRIEEADLIIKSFGFLCSIRTDCCHGVTKDLPFYLIEDPADYFKARIQIQEHLHSGMVLLISDGRHYDGFLKYNMVMSVAYDGTFRAEYSTQNVPLRHMYWYPKDLINITGHIDERYASWEILNRENNKISIREIKNLLYQVYLKIEQLHLYNCQIELSVYKIPCGVLHEHVIYWEI